MTQKVKETKLQTKKVVKKVAKPDVKEQLDDTNKKVVTQKVIVNRVIKYRYPKGCNDQILRKAFRQKVRNAIRKMEREIAKLKGEDRRILKEKLDGYLVEVLL